MPKVVLYSLYTGAPALAFHNAALGEQEHSRGHCNLDLCFLNSKLKCLCSLGFFSYFVSIIYKNNRIESKYCLLLLISYVNGVFVQRFGLCFDFN